MRMLDKLSKAFKQHRNSSSHSRDHRSSKSSKKRRAKTSNVGFSSFPEASDMDDSNMQNSLKSKPHSREPRDALNRISSPSNERRRSPKITSKRTPRKSTDSKKTKSKSKSKKETKKTKSRWKAEGKDDDESDPYLDSRITLETCVDESEQLGYDEDYDDGYSTANDYGQLYRQNVLESKKRLENEKDDDSSYYYNTVLNDDPGYSKKDHQGNATDQGTNDSPTSNRRPYYSRKSSMLSLSSISSLENSTCSDYNSYTHYNTRSCNQKQTTPPSPIHPRRQSTRWEPAVVHGSESESSSHHSNQSQASLTCYHHHHHDVDAIVEPPRRRRSNDLTTHSDAMEIYQPRSTTSQNPINSEAQRRNQQLRSKSIDHRAIAVGSRNKKGFFLSPSTSFSLPKPRRKRSVEPAVDSLMDSASDDNNISKKFSGMDNKSYIDPDDSYLFDNDDKSTENKRQKEYRSRPRRRRGNPEFFDSNQSRRYSCPIRMPQRKSSLDPDTNTGFQNRNDVHDRSQHDSENDAALDNFSDMDFSDDRESVDAASSLHHIDDDDDDDDNTNEEIEVEIVDKNDRDNIGNPHMNTQTTNMNACGVLPFEIPMVETAGASVDIYGYGDAAPDIQAKTLDTQVGSGLMNPSWESLGHNSSSSPPRIRFSRKERSNLVKSQKQNTNPYFFAPKEENDYVYDYGHPVSDSQDKPIARNPNVFLGAEPRTARGLYKTPRRSSMKQTGAVRRTKSNGDGDLVEITLPQGHRDRKVMRRRSITFSEQIETKDVIPVTELADNPENLWFQSHEFEKIREKRYALVERVTKCDPVIKNGKKLTPCVRGLENMFQKDRGIGRLKGAWKSVFKEQNHQKSQGYFDDEYVANMYRYVSNKSRVEACQRAQQDRSEVKTYLQETRRKYRRMSM